ncbi:MAG: hypothetical protein K0Q79_3380 [Flavipsychrobacter sp.]|jgi:hypothetical protein|nr:hypothetical protein [Flavipsychrobacter sp.]
MAVLFRYRDGTISVPSRKIVFAVGKGLVGFWCLKNRGIF